MQKVRSRASVLKVLSFITLDCRSPESWANQVRLYADRLWRPTPTPYSKGPPGQAARTIPTETKKSSNRLPEVK